MRQVQATPTAVLDRLIREAVPDQRGLGAWRAFLRAHASLMRSLATDLVAKTGVTLGDFDVLVGSTQSIPGHVHG